MSFVTNILTPIITSVVIGGFVLWILFLVYKGIKKAKPDFNFWFKYTIIRKKYDEKVVMWCMDAISKEMNEAETYKFLLIKGIKPKRTKEMMYIYNQVLNKLEGGNQNVKFRQSNEQTNLPEISKKN